MGRWLLRLWWITGIGSAIVLAFPWLVIIGAMALIIPGLILGALPTAFLWLTAFMLAWIACATVLGKYWSILPALGIAAAALWLIPGPSRVLSQNRLDAALKDADVIPASRIALRGDVRLSQVHLDAEKLPEGTPWSRERDMSRPFICDGLCAALLSTPGVTSVTMVTHSRESTPGKISARSRTYRLLPVAQCPALTVRPKHLTLDFERPKTKPGQLLANTYSPEAEWDLRLSTGECIRADAPLARFDMQVAIFDYQLPKDGKSYGHSKWSLGPYPVHVNRFTISDSSGRIIFRKTLARTMALARPLYIEPTGGMDSSFSFGWARTEFSNRKKYEELKPDRLLQAHSNIYLGASPERMVQAAKTRLTQLLDDPAIPATDTGFDLTRMWFTSFRPAGQKVSAEDISLIKRMIADPRVKEFGHLGLPVEAMGDDSIALRDVIGARILSTNPPEKWTRALASQYAHMPEGALGTPTSTEIEILEDPKRRMFASGLIARQADRGSAAVPYLIDIMRYHLSQRKAAQESRGQARYDANDHMLPFDAARRAFCLMGPKGASALPQIEAMEAEGVITPYITESREWHMMLARLGKPIASIPKPDNRSGTADSFHRNLEERLRKFDPKKSCTAQW